MRELLSWTYHRSIDRKFQCGAFVTSIVTISKARRDDNRYGKSQVSACGDMNRLHRWLCHSDRWRATVQQRVPWVLDSRDLGPNVLELGPGPGLTTDLLRMSLTRLTALEIDLKLASALAARLRGSNVEVIEGDATTMPFTDSEFSGAVSFTMLHHVPSRELQDKVLREVFRVLRPGAFFVGSDSRQSLLMRLIHIGDTLVPVDPDSFGRRLESAGFEVHAIEKANEAFRFRARRPVSHFEKHRASSNKGSALV